MSPSSQPDPNGHLNTPGIALNDLILDYTRLCNSRCTYCGIWREKDRPELAIEVIGRLFQAQALQQLTSCYVTGGEPYISDKIVEIARLLHRFLPHARLSGATNGIQPAKILSRVLAIRELGCPVTVDVSLNGNEATHDRTRGQPGFWRNALGLVQQLKAQGIPTNLAFSVMPETITPLCVNWQKTWDAASVSPGCGARRGTVTTPCRSRPGASTMPNNCEDLSRCRITSIALGYTTSWSCDPTARYIHARRTTPHCAWGTSTKRRWTTSWPARSRPRSFTESMHADATGAKVPAWRMARQSG